MGQNEMSDDTAVDEGNKGADTGADTSPVSFFHPALKGIRSRITLQWFRTVMILSVFIFGILSLFWAVQFSVDEHMSNLKVWVVDFDSQDSSSTDPIVGPAVTDTASSIIDSKGANLGYIFKSPVDFGNDPIAVRQSIYDQHAWAAVIVYPNATANLQQAIQQGDTSYNPQNAAEFVVISARDQTTYSSYIIPQLNDFGNAALAAFGPKWIEYLAHNNTTDMSSAFSKVPQAVSPGIGFTLTDLRPFGPPTITPTVTIGLIYLIIIAFFNTPFLMPVHMQYVTGKHRPLKIPHFLIWRILSNLTAYFILSLFYSLVSLAFQIPFSNPPAPGTVSATNPNAYGRASFVVYWMLNWVGMSALGLPCENMAMVLGFPWSSFFLIFWVISNVGTGFYALELAPGFYRWGYAWPLHYIVEASRTILFDTRSRIGLDFGVLFAWVGVSIIFFPFASLINKWRIKKFGR